MLKATQITLNTVQVQDTALVIEATHYLDDNIAPKANLIYLHGGGLLYGTKRICLNDILKHLLKLVCKFLQ